MGRSLDPLTEACVRRLQAHSWPGNVRELENVIELAVITAQNGRLNLDRALPQSTATPVDSSPAQPPPAEAGRILTAELGQLERRNILAALEGSSWRVAGEQGAARRLGLKPTTLKSRIKALGIQRSAGKSL